MSGYKCRGEIIDNKGRKLMRKPEHPRASYGYVLEHILIAEENMRVIIESVEEKYLQNNPN